MNYFIKRLILVVSVFFVFFSCSENNQNKPKKIINSTERKPKKSGIFQKRKISSFPQKIKKIKVIKEFSFVIFSTDIGWGYDILQNGKQLVHQPHIPAIQGLQGFSSKVDAEKVANEILIKCSKGIMPPTLSIDEMKKLNVIP